MSCLLYACVQRGGDRGGSDIGVGGNGEDGDDVDGDRGDESKKVMTMASCVFVCICNDRRVVTLQGEEGGREGLN